jgi:hypothetical protein
MAQRGHRILVVDTGSHAIKSLPLDPAGVDGNAMETLAGQPGLPGPVPAEPGTADAPWAQPAPRPAAPAKRFAPPGTRR